MLTPEEIQKMIEEMGSLSDDSRANFLDWSKQTISPEKEKRVFIHLVTNNTKEGDEEIKHGKLE